MKKIFYVGLAAAMISFTSCGGSDKSNTPAVDSTETAANSTLGVVSIAEPAITHAQKDYIQVVKVTPVGLTCEKDNRDGSRYIYAKGSITVKCIKEIKEDSTYDNSHIYGFVTLLDANGMSLYDNERSFDEQISTEGMTLGQEKTEHYKIKICYAGDTDLGVITDQEILDKYLGPVKFVQITY